MFEYKDPQQLLDYYLSLQGKARKQAFVTVTEAADLIGHSRTAILNMINEDKIAAVLVVDRYEIEKASLIAFLKQRAEVA